MDKRHIEALIKSVESQINEKGLVEDADCFEYLDLHGYLESEKFDIRCFDDEIEYMDKHWDIDLNYSIRACNKMQVGMRKMLRKLRRILLFHFSKKQNALNYCTLQSMKLIRLYMEQMYQENIVMRRKQEELEERLQELIKKMG